MPRTSDSVAGGWRTVRAGKRGERKDPRGVVAMWGARSAEGWKLTSRPFFSKRSPPAGRPTTAGSNRGMRRTRVDGKLSRRDTTPRVSSPFWPTSSFASGFIYIIIRQVSRGGRKEKQGGEDLRGVEWWGLSGFSWEPRAGDYLCAICILFRDDDERPHIYQEKGANSRDLSHIWGDVSMIRTTWRSDAGSDVSPPFLQSIEEIFRQIWPGLVHFSGVVLYPLLYPTKDPPLSIDHRCEDGRIPVFASCVTISNPQFAFQ